MTGVILENVMAVSNAEDDEKIRKQEAARLKTMKIIRTVSSTHCVFQGLCSVQFVTNELASGAISFLMSLSRFFLLKYNCDLKL